MPGPEPYVEETIPIFELMEEPPLVVAEDVLPLATAEPEPVYPEFGDSEVTHKVKVTVYQPPSPPPDQPFDDPFGLESPAAAGVPPAASAIITDDVFAAPEPPPAPAAAPPESQWFADEPTPDLFDHVGAQAPPGNGLPPGVAAAAIQRVVPRALAQLGEVRELEVEVPVPSAWTGGRRVTLQLRLTLVPQEEPNAD